REHAETAADVAQLRGEVEIAVTGLHRCETAAELHDLTLAEREPPGLVPLVRGDQDGAEVQCERALRAARRPARWPSRRARRSRGPCARRPRARRLPRTG